MQTYHLTMDDGKRLDIPADSAAVAIRRALAAHLNHYVTGCFAGGLAQDNWAAGRMDYTIPPHDPLTEYNLRKYKDGTQTDMFPEAEITEESTLAKVRAEQDRIQSEIKLQKKADDGTVNP